MQYTELLPHCLTDGNDMCNTGVRNSSLVTLPLPPNIPTILYYLLLNGLLICHVQYRRIVVRSSTNQTRFIGSPLAFTGEKVIASFYHFRLEDAKTLILSPN
jgi:hypothetical protein